MKIIFISSRSLDKIGGIETYMANLLPLLVEKGHDVILFSECPRTYVYRFKGVKVYCVKSIQNKILNKLIVSIIATFRVVFKEKNVDLIHYNAIPCGFLSIIPLLLGKNVIFQGHGFEWQRAKWKPWQQKIIRAIESITLRMNKNITMVSQDQSDYVKKKFHKNSLTITPGVHVPYKVKLNEKILEKYGLTKGKFLLSLGRLVPEKKVDVLIEAFNESKIPQDIKLVIAGDAAFSSKYINEIKEKANNNLNIIFTGTVYGEDKECLLSNCLAFVIPSELEGLPITLLESMSYGKICIASDIPSNIEALGENGIFFKVNDKIDLKKTIEKVVLNINEYEKYGYKNLLRVKEEFTWDKIAAEYEQFARLIIKNN